MPAESAPETPSTRRLIRDLILTVAVFAVLLGGLLAYTRTWPPLATITSDSMAHGEGESAAGTLDPGDVVAVQGVSARSDVITYLEGRATGYRTYGDFGDVIVFDAPGEPAGSTYVHRSMAFVEWNASANAYDVPDLERLPASAWTGWDAAGNATARPFALSRFVLHGAGWRQDLDIAFNLTAGERILAVGFETSGLLTMGDENAYTTLTKVDRWVVPPANVRGVARGELPWVGLVHLTLAPDPEGCCASWGSTDPTRGAPANSWAALDALLLVGVAIVAAWTAAAVYLGRHPEVRERIRERVQRLRPWRRESEGGVTRQR